ncbi:MAG: hypothetical protein IPJ03_15240 [Ignavibacteriales bacterium]|nr:hypothetical protein [Ignavibacteriales bacterium]
MEILQNIDGNTILNVISLFVGLLGILLAVIFFVKSIKKKIPYYEVNSFNIISTKLEKKINDIEIFYKGQKVTSVTVSKIVIWNSGNETIRKSDIPETNKFTIDIEEDYEIYNYEILSITDSDCTLELKQETEGIVLDFNYLEPNQGFVVKLTHSGNNSNCLSLTGKVIGGNKLEHKILIDTINTNEDLVFLRSLPLLTSLLFDKRFSKFFLIVFGIVIIVSALYETDTSLKITLFVLGGVFILRNVIAIFKKGIPNQLKKKFEEE